MKGYNMHCRNYSGVVLILLVFCQVAFAQHGNSGFGNSEAEALEAFGIGNSLLQSQIDGSVSVYSDVIDQAIDRYWKALELKPDFAEAYYNIGICYVMDRREDDRRLTSALRYFDFALEKDPSLIDAHYAKAYAQYYVKTGSKAAGSKDWNKAVQPAINMAEEVIVSYPNSEAATKSKALLKLIEWQRKNGIVGAIKNKSSRPTDPGLNPLSVKESSNVEEIVKRNISRIETGVISDEVATIKITHGGGGGEYYECDKVKNTNGLTLKNFCLRFQPYDCTYEDTFMHLFVTFSVGGRDLIKERFKLPAPGKMIWAVEKGTLDTSPLELFEMENVKVSLAYINATANPNNNIFAYETFEIRVITEIVE